ncbi:MAG: hypothetical protein HYY50_05355 [Candidatus Kerfeldbacteria bacterium]|nr:hypothetical protein [Candidatus Kerfeldbacteria bacterium]
MSSDRRFWWAVTFVALAWSIVPFLIGWALTPRGYEFYGNSALNPSDPGVYYSYIEQGRHGSPFMYDAFTSEPHRATLWQPLWWLVGRLAALFGASTPTAYILARWLAVPILVLSLWSAMKWIFRRPLDRRVGLVLALFGGGIGGWLTLGQQPVILTTAPDLWVAEALPSLTLLSSPHFILITAGLVFMLVSVERFWAERRWSFIGWAGLVAAGVLSLHPFHIFTWLVAWLLLTAVHWARSRKFPWRYVLGWLAVLFMASPMLILFGLQRLFDPLTVARAAQNITTTWSWPNTFVLVGLVGGAAAVGLWRLRSTDWRWRWLITILAAYVIAIYLPLPFQRRLSQGMFMFVAALAVPAVARAWEWTHTHPQFLRWPIIGLFVVIMSFSGARVIGAIVSGYLNELRAGAQYLSYHSPELRSLISSIRPLERRQGAVLASVTNSQAIAALAAQPVYIGHGIETVRFNDKLKQLRQFYQSMDQTEERQFLRGRHICFVLDGPRERAYGTNFQAAQWPDLERFWSGPTMALYRLSDCP